MRHPIVIGVGMGSFIWGVILALMYGFGRTLPPTEFIEEYSPPVSTKLYDCNGNLIYEFYRERREPVPLDEISSHIIHALLVSEDRHFYEHTGVMPRSMVRAIWMNIRYKRPLRGTSTITQQLARLFFLYPEKSIIRKIREILMAWRLEKEFSKDEILEMYLNHIYFGNGLYGVEASSRGYFGKPAHDITPDEAATLIPIIRAPAEFDPYKHPDRVLHIRNRILDEMARFGYIEPKLADSLKQLPLHVRSPIRQQLGTYFIEEVRRWFIKQFGSYLLYEGGVKIYTTLDTTIQRVIEEEAAKHMDYLYKTFDIEDDSLHPLELAVVVLDPNTREVKALLGGRDFKRSQFNRATQARRQAGSAFKPFVWIAALERGYTASTIVEDKPISIPLVTGEIYSPTNYDSVYYGPITMRKAISLSRNLVAVRLGYEVGPDAVVDVAKRMGVRSPLMPVYSLALGTSGVTLLEMCNAYATIAAYGIHKAPIFVRKVVDRTGNVLFEARNDSVRAISTQVAYVMTSLLKSVVDEGTARSIRYFGFKGEAAGKTGTTDNSTDAWFIGYTPRLLTGVWVGFDSLRKIANHAVGGNVAAPLWARIMKRIDTDDTLKFTQPTGIVTRRICDESGKLATPYCKRTRDEVYIAGTEPHQYCDIHHKPKEHIIEFERKDLLP